MSRSSSSSSSSSSIFAQLNAAEYRHLSRHFTKLGLGSAVLLYGYHFPGTVLFVSSLRVAGLTGIGKQLTILSKAAGKTATALRDQSPEIIQQLQEIANLTEEIKALQRSFESKSLPAKEYLEKKAKLEADLVRAKELETRMNETIETIGNSIDYRAIQEVLSQLFDTLTGCVAAASSKHMRICSIGCSIGHVISDRLLVVLRARRESLTQSLKALSHNVLTSAAQVSSRGDGHNAIAATAFASHAESQVSSMLDEQDWITPVARGFGNCVGWILAYYLQTLAHAASACSIGAEMVVSSLQEIADPFLLGLNLPSSRSPQYSVYIAGAQTALTGIAFSRALFGSRSLPGGILGSIALFPLTIVESSINAVFFVLGVIPQ